MFQSAPGLESQVHDAAVSARGAESPSYGALFQSARPLGAERSCLAVAHLAALAQLCLGAAPVVLALKLGLDPDAQHWVGSVGCWALAAPAFTVLLYLLHLRLIQKCRQDVGVFAAMLLPPVALAFLGGWYAFGARAVHGHLLEKGCESKAVPEAASLQREYEGARQLWSACLARTLAENGGVPPLRRPALPACHEWSAAIGQIPAHDLAQLRYLATAEASHSCGGFCSPGPAIFNSPDEVARQSEACVVPVGRKLLSLARKGDKLLGAALAEFLALLALLAAANPLLARLGYTKGGKSMQRSEIA